MELSYKEKTTKYLVYCLVLTAAALIQNVFAVRLELFGARCFIVLPTAIVLAVREHEWAASLLGLYAGALLDIFSAQHGGYSCIVLMLGCYIVSALVEYIFRNNFIFTMIACVSFTVIYVIFYWIICVLIKSADGAGGALAHFYLPCIIYTAFASPLVYLALSPLQRRLNKEERTAA